MSGSDKNAWVSVKGEEGVEKGPESSSVAETADLFQGNPQAWLEQVRKRSEFTIIVYYRGIWCPYCRAYLEELDKLHEHIKSIGGQVFGLCADTPQDVEATVRKWKVSFPIISDRSHVLAKYLKSEGILPVVITGRGGDVGYRGAYYTKHPRMSKYEHGCVQPGLLVLPRTGGPWFRWHIEPKVMNLGGASDRPVLKDVLAIVEKKLAGDSPGTCVEGSEPHAVRLTSKCKLTVCSIM